jgi:hypothetical protein
MEYCGHAYKILLRAIDEVHVLPWGNHYAKIFPVAQLSGTGKSKTGQDRHGKNPLAFVFT